MAIECPKCQTNNPKTSSYCADCGTQLPSLDEVSPALTKTIETPAEELTTGSTFAGRYQIIEELGKGGMGKVYRALDKELKEEIALKLVKPEIASDKKTIERFNNELRLARKIAHKNIGRMYELMEDKGIRFITMEYIPGEDLKSMIRMSGQLSIGTAISIAKQTCEGLAEAHKLGIIHRDLKPSNIIIDKTGTARIMDFGIARSLTAKGITGAGVMIGTPEYMSPEQVEGKEADQRSDIYSLGIILYEMLTGRLPFEADTPFAVGIKQKSEAPEDPKTHNPRIPDDLSQIVLNCLEKDKDQRYQSAGEVRSALEAIEKGIPTTEREIPKKRPLTSKEITVTVRRPWMAVAALFVIVLVAVAAIFILRKERPVTSQIRRNMLVVLPFENLGSPDEEYFADGMTEEITSRLSALHGLGVISRSSAVQYKETNKTIKQIGEELGVDYVLEGTVRWERQPEGRGRVRVTPQLIRVSDDTHLWSDRYDREIEDIFAVQSEIAEQIIKQLDLTVLEPEREAMLAQPTDNMEAYDYYLRGQEFWRKGMETSDFKIFEQGIQMFEKATELDPGLAIAYVWIATLHRVIYFFGMDQTEERKAKWKAALDKAAELQPDSPGVLQAQAYYYYQAFLDYDKALEILERVQKAWPNVPPELLGFIQRRQGQWEESLVNLEKSFKLNPRIAWIAYEVAMTYMSMRRYQEADLWLNRALSINPNLYEAKLIKFNSFLFKGDKKQARTFLQNLPEQKDTDYAFFELGMAERNFQDVLDRFTSLEYDSHAAQNFYFHKDLILASVYRVLKDSTQMKVHAEKARAELENAVGEHSQDPRYHSALGIAYAFLDLKDDAVREGKQAVELYPVSKDALDGPNYVFNLAMIYTLVGEHEEAITQLEYLLSIHSGSLLSVQTLQLDPRWDPLRSHPRYQQMLKKHATSD